MREWGMRHSRRGFDRHPGCAMRHLAAGVMQTRSMVVTGAHDSQREEGVMAEGYCVKCKAKKEMKDTKEVTMKNKRKAVKGTCPSCGTGMFKILGK